MKVKTEKNAEQLKDRQAYRQTLIFRRNELDKKLATVEEQISILRK